MEIKLFAPRHSTARCSSWESGRHDNIDWWKVSFVIPLLVMRNFHRDAFVTEFRVGIEKGWKLFKLWKFVDGFELFYLFILHPSKFSLLPITNTPQIYLKILFQILPPSGNFQKVSRHTLKTIFTSNERKIVFVSTRQCFSGGSQKFKPSNPKGRQTTKEK